MNDSRHDGRSEAPLGYGDPRFAAPVAGQAPYAQASYGQEADGHAYGVPPLPPGVWTPPRKPGLLPLRPLSFGALLGTPFQVLRRNPGPTFGSALITQLVGSLSSVLIIGGVGFFAFSRIASAPVQDQEAIIAGSWALLILSSLIPLGLTIVCNALLQGVLVVEVASGTLGEKNRMGTLWRRTGERLWPLIAWFATITGAFAVAMALIVGIAIGVSVLVGIGPVVGILLGIALSLCLLVLGVWLGIKTALVPCIVVLERRGMRTAIARSWILTAGSFWKTFGVLALIAGILYFAAQVLTTPVSLVLGFVMGFLFPNGPSDEAGIASVIAIYGVVLLVSLVLGAITAVVQSSAVAVVYLDLRMRKEGLDFDLIRYIDARQTGASDALVDPYLARSHAV